MRSATPLVHAGRPRGAIPAAAVHNRQHVLHFAIHVRVSREPIQIAIESAAYKRSSSSASQRTIATILCRASH